MGGNRHSTAGLFPTSIPWVRWARTWRLVILRLKRPSATVPLVAHEASCNLYILLQLEPCPFPSLNLLWSLASTMTVGKAATSLFILQGYECRVLSVVSTFVLGVTLFLHLFIRLSTHLVSGRANVSRAPSFQRWTRNLDSVWTFQPCSESGVRK